MEKKLKLKVNALIQTIELKTGNVKKETRVHNLVVDTGLDEVIDSGLVNIGHMALGEDNTAVQSTDTELGTEVEREAVAATDEGTGVREYDKTFTFLSGESYTIVEAGLFNSAIASGSLMFNRLVFTGHEVDTDNGVRVVITITLTAV